MARIAGINIPQNKIVSIALTYIHGIGLHSSKKICKKLNIPNNTRVNQLTEDQVLKIREFIDQNHKVEGDLRREISVNINNYCLVVTKSTVPVGTTRKIKEIISQKISNDKFYISCTFF